MVKQGLTLGLACLRHPNQIQWRDRAGFSPASHFTHGTANAAAFIRVVVGIVELAASAKCLC
jgi:hypothetical protein